MWPKKTTAAFLRTVQEEAGARNWSEGVKLTRLIDTFSATKMDEEECVVHLRIPSKPLAPKVTLWPEEEDWDCDCGASHLPCEHIAAVAIALNQGKVSVLSQEAVEESGSSGQQSVPISYEFHRSPEGLLFERRFVEHGEKRRIDIPMLSYLSGLKVRGPEAPKLLVTKADYAVDSVLKNHHWDRPLVRPQLEALFSAFDSDQKIFLDGQPVEISTFLLTARYECIDEAEGYRLRRVPNELIDQQFRFGVALCGEKLHLMKSTRLTPDEQKLCEGEGSFWELEREGTLFRCVIPSLQKKIEIEIKSVKAPKALEVKPRVDLLLEKDELYDGRACLSVVANIVYGNPEFARLNPKTLELVAQGNFEEKKKLRNLKRDVEQERVLIRKLERELQLQPARHVEYQGPDAVDFCAKLTGWDYRGKEVYGLFSPHERELIPDLQIQELTGGRVSFEVSFLLPGVAEGASGASVDSSVDFSKAMSAFELGESAVPLLDGSWAKVPADWLEKHGEKLKNFFQSRELSRVELERTEQPELLKLCEGLESDGATEEPIEIPSVMEPLRALIRDFREIQRAPLPEDLQAELRHYQEAGVNWLHFLKTSGMGALLADDMGLGKTLQTLTVLKGRCLVVAPTSVLFNWAAEAAKFRPGLTVCHYHGGDRKLDPNADITLTSYGLLRMDQELLSSQEWDTIVLDEAQAIKNPSSQVTRAAHSMKAKFKIALTGTPVENSLDDLWSQFHFINPGLLPMKKEEFQEAYARPINGGNAGVATKLRNRIKPFILRRLKQEVATELPEKSEVLLQCELSSEERAVYDLLIQSTRNEVMAKLEEGGSIMEALELILRLRQACCHASLVPGQENFENSSKVATLMASLKNVVGASHKALVFSQWTSFLDIISSELKKEGIPTLRIDGSTQNRGDVVERFQNTQDAPVMLLSLKAGGVGLNLTAADHVYIMDPWWNPSVEDQAADRAYRIGQKNPVLVQKLIAKGTLEEKILELQKKKKDLAASVLSDGKSALALSRQDLMELLS